jgi:hypothetical protein
VRTVIRLLSRCLPRYCRFGVKTEVTAEGVGLGFRITIYAKTGIPIAWIYASDADLRTLITQLQDHGLVVRP